MKKLFGKILILVVLFFSNIITVVCASKESQTFFKPRTVANSSILPLALGNFHMHHNNHEKSYIRPKHWLKLNLQKACFYQESYKGDDLARYFFFGDKSTLHVKEDGSGDVWSRWLRLEAPDYAYNFDSKITMYPKRKVYGAVIKYKRDLSEHLNGAWFSVMLPVVKVEHDLRLQEFDKFHLGVVPPTTTERSTVVDALNHPDWKYGKFSPKKLTRSGIDDGLIKFGFNAWGNRTSHVDFFGTFLAPLGNQPKAEHVFEPMVGNGRHMGVGVGTDFDCALLTGRKRYIHLLGNIRSEYLLGGVERRPFDLKNNGPWSRYLLVVKEGDTTDALPGINFFTKDMWVVPQWNFNALFALHGEFSNFNIELGYNFWWKDSEKVRLYHQWDENAERIGIADPTDAMIGTASAAKINDTVNTLLNRWDPRFVKITQNDLDLLSATHGSAASHSIYGALSMNWNILNNPVMVGGGVFCEFSDSNTALQQWGSWLQTGISF